MAMAKGSTKPQAHYSEDFKVGALAMLRVNDNNITKTATQLGLPRVTLRAWAHRLSGITQAVEAKIPQHVKSLADRLDEIAHLCCDAIPGKIEKAALSQVSVSLAIAVDKMRLLRDQPTAITQDLTTEQRVEALKDLLDAARAQRVEAQRGVSQAVQSASPAPVN